MIFLNNNFMNERNNNTMEKITMNVKELTKAVAVETGMTQKAIGEIITAMDSIVGAQLAQANENTSVEVKILPSGVTLVSTYNEAHEAKNPQTGEVINVPGKNRVKAKLGTTIKAAVNA